MNAHKIKIPIVEFDEVKFEPVVLRSKRSLKPAFARGGNPAAWFGRSEFVRAACPILPATSATFAEELCEAPGW